MEKNIGIFEGKRASNYDHFVQDWIPNYEYFIKNIPNILRIDSPEKILVVGCGTGNEMLQLAKGDKYCSITGIDPSPEMIAIAASKLKSYQNISLFEGTLEQLPRSKKEYDAATLLLVLHFIKDDGSKLSLLKEISARLKSGGTLLILDIFGSKKTLSSNLKILRATLPSTIDNPEIEERFDRIMNKLYHITENRLQELLIQAGFETPNRFYQMSIYGGWMTKKI